MSVCVLPLDGMIMTVACTHLPRLSPFLCISFAVVLDADGSMFALIIANASDKFSLREGDIISLDHFSSCLQEGKFNEKVRIRKTSFCLFIVPVLEF